MGGGIALVGCFAGFAGKDVVRRYVDQEDTSGRGCVCKRSCGFDVECSRAFRVGVAFVGGPVRGA